MFVQFLYLPNKSIISGQVANFGNNKTEFMKQENKDKLVRYQPNLIEFTSAKNHVQSKRALLSIQEGKEDVEESTHFCYIKHRLKLVKHHTQGLKNLLSLAASFT